MIYLASPFFNDKERAVKSRIKEVLERNEYQVYDPQSPSSPYNYEDSNAEWGQIVYTSDIEAIENSNYVIAIDWGLYGDNGTAFEVGYARAKGKKVIVVVPNEALSKEHSLMVANGCHNFISEKRFIDGLMQGYALNDLSADLDYFLFGVIQK